MMDMPSGLCWEISDGKKMAIVQIAMKKAVEMGVFPSACFPDQYIENWEAMAAIVMAVAAAIKEVD